jgi:hypothetical protein
MKIFLAASLIAAAQGYIDYPVFVDPTSRVEAVIDRGPILELIVACSEGNAIISYSKMEQTYCSPTFKCGPHMERVIEQSCG